jgi:amino acid adenylation domain-containing protein
MMDTLNHTTLSAPLTPLQRFFHARQQANPDVPFYNVVFTFTLGGAVDAAAFQQAFQAVLNHTDSLRTVIKAGAEGLWQQVLPPFPYAVDGVDLSSEADPDTALARWLAARTRRASTLSEHLFDTALLRLGPDRTVWYFNQHHLVTDGWSTQLLYRQVALAYHHARSGTLATFDLRVPSFPALVAATDAAPADAAARRARAYWDARLAEPVPPLAFYQAVVPERTLQERRTSHALGATRTARLEALAQAEVGEVLGRHLARLTVLLTALLAYLYRLTGQRHLSVGTLFHNRVTARERQTPGLFQQLLPLVVLLDPTASFRSLLGTVRQGLYEALRHGAYSPGTLTHPAAFDVILNYLPITFSPFDGLPVTATWIPTGVGDGHRSLGFIVHDFNATSSLVLETDTNTGAFDDATASCVPEHLLWVLDQGLAAPDQPLDEMTLLTEAGRGRLLEGFNRAPVSYPAHRTTAWLFEAQVERTPAATALTFGSVKLTYAALNARANHLAHHLRQMGVQPGRVVALFAERSVEALVGMLGILKAGGVYLPLDPAYPAERLRFMLEDSQAPFLLCRQNHMPAFLPSTCEPVLLEAFTSEEVLPNLPQAAGADDPAYIIYTSGSTGRPKGVVLPHRVLLNLVWWQVHEASRLVHPRTVQYTPLSFDVSLQETFACWASGGTLVLLTEATRQDPVALLHLLRDEAIAQLYLTPTALQQLAQAAERTGLVPEHLREVISAGEALTITPVLRRFFAQLPDAVLHNQYGPSETHIVTGAPLTGPPQNWPTLPSIGLPVWNTTAYVLDAQRRLVPPGVPGELYLGGVQVATGYLDRPSLTAERFLDDPFRDVPGGCMYKTGDLVRCLPDGSLQFLGRLDHQVKVRGFRIEPGESEAVRGEHPGVREAAVVARTDDGASTPRLVAYVVPAPGSPPPPADLRAFLEPRLPAYMVPAAFVLLDALPRTPSGKVDRLALPAPEALRPAHDRAYVPPRTAAEQTIAAAWQAVLRIDQAGLHDNFFALGGDSLLLAEVHARLQVDGYPGVSLIDLFQYPTIAALARRLEGDTGPASRDDVADRARQQQAALERQKTRHPSFRSPD